MIKDKSVYDPIEEKDGFRLLVTRKWPRGIGWRKHRIDCWKKELGPPMALLDDWNQRRISWSEYTERYVGYVRSCQHLLDEVRSLEEEHGTVTLLCCERAEPEEALHCHRVLLKELLCE